MKTTKQQAESMLVAWRVTVWPSDEVEGGPGTTYTYWTEETEARTETIANTKPCWMSTFDRLRYGGVLTPEEHAEERASDAAINS